MKYSKIGIEVDRVVRSGFLAVLEVKRPYTVLLLIAIYKMDSQIREEKYAADICSIKEAQARISSFIHKTPVLSSETLDALSGRRLFFKCELFQKG